MADVLLLHAADGGNIEAIAGRVTMSRDGFFNAVYMSLFGGNQHDGGGDADLAREWWGNKIEPDPARKLRSRFQHLVASTPLIPANLPRFEGAAAADLAWMVSGKFATYAGATATIPALNVLNLAVRIEADGEAFPFDFKDLRP